MKIISATVALGAVVASLVFAQWSVSMTDGDLYKAVDVQTDGGLWQEIDGRLSQTDASVQWAKAIVPPIGTPDRAEYSFDVSYIDGLEDNVFGFGVNVLGYDMRLVWDPANLGGSGLHAQVYNTAGELHEHYEIPASTVADILAKIAVNDPILLKIRTDYNNGNLWVQDLFDTTWYMFQPFDSPVKDNNRITFSTVSGQPVSVSLGYTKMLSSMIDLQFPQKHGK